MEWPNNDATKLTEHIMVKIKDCLKTDEKGYPNHYNHVFENIHQILTAYLPKRLKHP